MRVKGTESRSAAATRSWRSERGLSLIEMVIVVALTAVVFTTLMVPIVTADRDQLRDWNYSQAQENARTGLDSMVNQIRQAWSILSTTSNSIEMDVNLSGKAYEVLYECDVPQAGTSYRECVRVQTNVGGTLPPLASGTIVVSNLVNGTATSPVFSFGPDPNAPYYMTATVQVPSSNGRNGGLTHPIVLSDGALMRNLNVGD